MPRTVHPIPPLGRRRPSPAVNEPQFHAFPHLHNDPKLSEVPEGFIWFNMDEQALKVKVDGMSKIVGVETCPTFGREASAAHYHKDASGFLHKCYHKCRSLFTWQFFAGITLSFPIEHALWTKVWPFHVIAEMLGLGIGHH